MPVTTSYEDHVTRIRRAAVRGPTLKGRTGPGWTARPSSSPGPASYAPERYGQLPRGPGYTIGYRPRQMPVAGHGKPTWAAAAPDRRRRMSPPRRTTVTTVQPGFVVHKYNRPYAGWKSRLLLSPLSFRDRVFFQMPRFDLWVAGANLYFVFSILLNMILSH